MPPVRSPELLNSEIHHAVSRELESELLRQLLSVNLRCQRMASSVRDALHQIDEANKHGR